MPNLDTPWTGVWLGTWLGPRSSGLTPPPSSGGSIITGGFGGGGIVLQGYGVSEEAIVALATVSWGGAVGFIIPDGGSVGGDIITGGYGGGLIILQGYGAAGSSEIAVSGGVTWGGSVGFIIPVPETFLEALVKMLRASTVLTTKIGGPRIFSTWPGPKTPLPFLVIEDYIESQPGETIEHNLNTVVFAAYGPDKVSVKTVLTALMNSVDSPAQNKFSTRVPMRWSTGTEESSWRQPTLPPIRMKMTMLGTDLWRWSIQYDFNILPDFQV